MSNKTTAELIQYLKKPFSGTGVPTDWTFNSTTNSYTHNKTGEVSPNPTTTSVNGIWDIYSAIELPETEYKTFLFNLVVSVESSGLDKDDKDKLRESVNELILLLDERRSVSSRLNSNLPGGAARATELAYNSKIAEDGAHTFIGPCPLGPDIPVVQVGIYENYKVEMMQSLMGLSDPAQKSSKADVVLEVKLSVPYGSINDRTDADGKTIRGLKSILGTLKVAPVCEIRSSAIYPVFVNSLLSPESFDVLRDRLTASDKGGITEHQEKINKSLSDGPVQQRDIDTLVRPANAPNSLAELTRVNVQYVKDGDTLVVNPTSENIETLSLDQDQLFSVRLIGINTPEISHRGVGVDEPGGREAFAALEEIISRASGEVYLESEATLRDDYGRNLRNVYIAGPDGKPQLVALELLIRGSARPFIIEPNSKYKSTLLDADSGSVIPGLRNFAKLLKEENPLINYISGSGSANGIDTPQNTAQRFITIPCAFKGYIIEAANNNHSMIVSLFFNRFNDDNFHNGKILYRDKDGEPTANVEDCPWIFKLAQYSVFSPNGTMNDFSVVQDILSFSWRDRQSGVNRSFTPDKSTLLIESINARGFMKCANIPVLNSPYGVSQYMGIDNIVAKIKMVCSSPYELARFHEMKAELDKISYGEYVDGVKLDTVRIYEPILYFLGAQEFLISSIATKKIEESDSWNIEIDIVESKIKSKDVEQISLLNTGMADEEDLKKIWDYLYDVLDGRGDQKDYKFVNELVFSPDNAGVNSLIDPNIMWATWLFQYQKKELGKERFISNSAQDNGEKFNNSIGNLFWQKDDSNTDPWSIFNSKKESVINKNWIQKGQDDLKDKVDVIESAFLDPALTEVRESAQEVLERIGINNLSGNQRINFTEQFWKDYYNLLIDNKIKPDTSSEPVWRQDEISIAREKIFGLISSAAYNNLSDKLKNTLTRYKTDLVQKETIISNQSKNVKLKVASNHAYITLPTYYDMFGSGDLWLKFAPTYEDMGKKVPYKSPTDNSGIQASQKLPFRNINDPVEPTFYLYHTKVKSEVVEARFKQSEEFSKVLESTPIISIPDKFKDSPASAIGDYITEIFRDPRDISDSSVENKRIERERLKNLREKVDSIGVFSEAGTYLGYAIKEGNLIKFKPVKGKKEVLVNSLGEATHSVFSAADNLKLTNDILARKPDFGLNPVRLYPSYRLYFIEPDSGYEIETDDLYGINSIMELGLRLDKYDTAVLTASISNVTNNLGEDEVISENTRERLKLSQDEDAQIFSRIKVQPGTLVKLYLGYGTLPKDLDCVFTGMITETRPGKIVEIVAQCHKRELLNEVQFYLNGTNHFDIIRKILEKSETPNLGAPVGAKVASWRTLKSMFPDMVDIRDYTGKYDKIMNTKIVNMRNIYLPSSGHIETERAVLQDRDTNIFAAIPVAAQWVGRRVGDWFATPWIVPPQSAWDAILEVTRHRPGTIAQVVPFGNKGTLFVGLPDQPYLAEKVTPEEELAYQKAAKDEIASYKDHLKNILNDFVIAKGGNNTIDIRNLAYDELNKYVERYSKPSPTGQETELRKLYGDRKDVLSVLSEKRISLVDIFASYFKLDLNRVKIEYPRLEEDIINLMGDPATSGQKLLFKLNSGENEYSGNIRLDYSEVTADPNTKYDQGSTLSKYRTMSDYFLSGAPSFKFYLIKLAEFIKENPEKVPAFAGIRSRDILPPGYKCFRDYHYISTKDIVSNNIYTSMEDMSNCILLRAPANPVLYGTAVSSTEDNRGESTETVTVDHDNSDWISYPTSDGVPFNYKVAKENRKLGVAAELNANTKNQKAMTLMSNMGLMLEPLYKGQLVVVGRNIKPYDVIFLDDGFNDMKGIIQVKSVVQTFSVETGWITEITPCAHVNVNNLSNQLQLISLNETLKYLSRGTELASNIVDIAYAIGFILLLIETGGASAAAAGSVSASAASTGAGSALGAAATTTAAAAGRAAIFRAAAGRALTNIGASRFTGSWLGRTIKGMGGTRGLLTGSALFAVNEVVDTFSSIYIKQQYESTQLPIDVHLLTYKGLPFQAGLSSSNEDIYSLYDKFVPGMTTFRQGLADFFTDVYNDLAGNSGKDYIENARKKVEEDE